MDRARAGPRWAPRAGNEVGTGTPRGARWLDVGGGADEVAARSWLRETARATWRSTIGRGDVVGGRVRRREEKEARVRVEFIREFRGRGCLYR